MSFAHLWTNVLCISFSQTTIRLMTLISHLTQSLPRSDAIVTSMQRGLLLSHFFKKLMIPFEMCSCSGICDNCQTSASRGFQNDSLYDGACKVLHWHQVVWEDCASWTIDFFHKMIIFVGFWPSIDGVVLEGFHCFHIQSSYSSTRGPRSFWCKVQL